MEHYAAIDVSLEWSSICIVDTSGRIVREAKVRSEREAVVAFFQVCRRFMTVPGVGAVVAMTFKSAIDQPERFQHSKAVGAHFGLTPRKYQSGEVDRTGRISKVGDAAVRTALFEAANILLTRAARWSSLKAWALRVATRQGMKKAKVALARKLAVVLHRMWLDGTQFRWGSQAAPEAVA